MSNSQQRILNITSAFNLRELGGYKTLDNRKIKWHKILRSGNLADLSKQDQETLKAYGVKYIIDFRSEYEINHWPDPQTKFYQIFPLPVYPLDGSGQKRLENSDELDYSTLEAIYQVIVLDDHAQKIYADFFDKLLNNDQPNQSLIFHCAAGKDRTGIAAMLFLKAMGVPNETINNDYLLTNLLYENSDLSDSLTDENIDSFISNMNKTTTTAKVADYIFKAIDIFYESFDNYLNVALNIDNKKLKLLKEIYLGD